MTAQDFVDGIRKAVLEASVDDSLAIVTKPPGRRPSEELSESSKWFNGLQEGDRAMVKKVLEFGVRNAVFGMLAVIDGARQIETTPGPKGQFELTFTKNAQTDVLAGPRGKLLHELL